MIETPEKSLLNESSIILINKYSNSSLVKSIIKNIYKLFYKKYSKISKNYNMNVIENIIHNEKSHIVAEFKDKLIIDDDGEFLKRYYKRRESSIRLPKFYEYYNLYSKIFPNYTILYEGKYIYQNIQKKQRMIDLQENLELQGLRNKEKNSSKEIRENKEKVFNTEAIDSILNGTNNEGIEILFNVNKNNIKQDEDIFKKDINNIIKIIKDNESKNKENTNVNINNNLNKNNNNEKNDINKDNISNKNISGPLNYNHSKNKRLRNFNLINTINNINTTNYNNIHSIIPKFLVIPSYQKNEIINLHDNTNKNIKTKSKSKIIQKKEKKLIEKLEQNLFKVRQKSICIQKNLSQNISTSNQTQKEISISKKNSILYNKKPSSSSISSHNKKNKNKGINNSSLSYKMSNDNFIKIIIKNKNLLIRKKNSALTSRNIIKDNIGLNFYNSKIKNIKGNTYNISEINSRNKCKNNNFQRKANSTLKERACSSCTKEKEKMNSDSKSNKLLNIDKNKFNDISQGKERRKKKTNNINNGIKGFFRNKNILKEKILYNEMNIISRNKNISQPKTIVNKKDKHIHRNESCLKIGFLDMINISKKNFKGINNNFSKILNASNINGKNDSSKTHRNNLKF